MLGDDIAAALPELRAHAESMMVDSCTISPSAPSSRTWDEATGAYTETPPLAVYSGPCRLRQPNQAEREAFAGEAEWTQWGVVLSLPVDSSTGVGVGMVVVVTACSWDASLVGASMRVVGPHGQSHATARRLRCVRVDRG